MKCCGKEMYDNGNNYHCAICGKRVYKSVRPTKCPQCGGSLYDNGNNVHCAKCGYRKYFDK